MESTTCVDTKKKSLKSKWSFQLVVVVRKRVLQKLLRYFARIWIGTINALVRKTLMSHKIMKTENIWIIIRIIGKYYAIKDTLKYKISLRLFVQRKSLSTAFSRLLAVSTIKWIFTIAYWSKMTLGVYVCLNCTLKIGVGMEFISNYTLFSYGSRANIIPHFKQPATCRWLQIFSYSFGLFVFYRFVTSF